MSYHALQNEAIQHCWPDAPVYRDLPYRLQNALAESYFTTQLTPNAQAELAVEIFAELGPLYRALIIENAFGNKIDCVDLATSLYLQAENLLEDDIEGSLDDFYRDYCASNGISRIDEYCVEERG